jgi:hypothetical protein
MGENDKNEEKGDIKKTCDDLFDYAIDREDVMWLVQRYSEKSNVETSNLEYELQILKIVGVGWNLFYFLEKSSHRNLLSESYWNEVRNFARELSEGAGKLAEKNIDYFGVLKERLDMYLAALTENSSEGDATKTIAPAFAKQCGDKDDVFAFMAGAKMFRSVSERVGRYLAETGMLD